MLRSRYESRLPSGYDPLVGVLVEVDLRFFRFWDILVYGQEHQAARLQRLIKS